jgi:hypothetical protein
MVPQKKKPVEDGLSKICTYSIPQGGRPVKPIYEDTEKALEGLIKTIYTALNSEEITAEEARILSNLVVAMQGTKDLFLEAIRKEG